MWKPEESASSSDESFEEEISTRNFGNFEAATGACKLKSVFEDIFADIQASIPTLELENSSEESDNDDEPLSYTREARPLSSNILSKTNYPSSKVDHSADTASPSDSELFLVRPDGQMSNTSLPSDGDQDSIEFLSSSPALLPSTLPNKFFSSSSTQTTTDTDSENPKQQRPMLSTSSRSTAPDPIDLSHEENQETVELSFDLLEHLNLGDYLECANEVTVPPLFPSTLSDSDYSDDADNSTVLMEGLIKLSEKQRNDAAPTPLSPADHHSKGPSERENNMVHSVGVMSSPPVTSKGVTASLDPSVSHRSNNTVFLDLRRQEKQASPQRNQELPPSICRILGISNNRQSESSSSSDEDDGHQSWQNQRRKAKEASLSCSRQNNGSVGQKRPPERIKSALDEIKPEQRDGDDMSNKKVTEGGPISQQMNCIVKESGQAVIGPGTLTIMHDGQLDLSHKAKVSTNHRTHTFKQTLLAASRVDTARLVPDVMQGDSTVDNKNLTMTETGKAQNLTSPEKTDKTIITGFSSPLKRDPLNKVENEVNKNITSAASVETKKSSVKHKQVLTGEERAKRQRLHKSLQNLKPQLSSHKHHPVAPCTPVLFHEEASYMNHLQSLPNLDTDTLYLLLTAKLSSCGELSVIHQGARGAVTPDTHCFSHLIAWLCCLVSPAMNTTDYAEICRAPFYVVSLQQSWHNGKLKIDVGLISRSDNGDFSRTQHANGKLKMKTNNSFRQAVSKFLSTNTLQSVYNRLSEHVPYPPHNLAELQISKKNLSTLLTVNPDPEAMWRVFGAKPGFFWQTMETEDAPVDDKTGGRLFQGPEIHNALMLMQSAVFRQPFCLLDVLIRAHCNALDIAGIRLVYSHNELHEEKPAFGFHLPNNSSQDGIGTGPQGPVMVLALRGPQAISKWQDEVGPVDAKLAQRTDPNSLRAVYNGGAKEDHLFWCPRSAQGVVTELSRWFGGRVPDSGVINTGCREPSVTCDENPEDSFLGRGRNNKSPLLTSSLHGNFRPPPYFLTASTDTSIFLFVSPALPVNYIGNVLSACLETGFCTQGVKRIHLNTMRLSGLGLSPEQISLFCRKRDNQSLAPLASTVLLLRRENALHHSLSVTESIVNSVSHSDLSRSCFLAVPYSDSMLKQLGGNFSLTPDPAAYPVDLLRHAFHSNPELEQVCVVTLLKEKATVSAGTLLSELLRDEEPQEGSNPRGGFELLGLKLLTSLSLHHAKEFTPCKIGDTMWKKSLKTLTSGPALVVALRSVNAFVRLRRFLDSYSDSSKSKLANNSVPLDILMSCTPELACRQLSVIFFDRELFSDQSARQNLYLLPPPRRIINGVCSGSSESLDEVDARASSSDRKARSRRVSLGKSPGTASLSSVETLGYADTSVLQSLLEKPRVIPTVCVLKPRTASKHLGKVLKRLGQEGFSVIALKMTCLSSKDVSTLMTEKEKLESHISHMTSGPSVVLCLHRENAVGRLLDVLGPSDARAAKKLSQFYLRGSFGEDSIQNGFYGSETYEKAIRDIKVLFPEGVCCPPCIDLRAEEIPCLTLDEVFSVTANRSLVKLSTEEQSRVETSPGMTLLPSSLLEINCLLLLPQLLVSGAQTGRRGNISYAEIIEALLTAGFHFIGLRMVLLGVAEAAHCAKLYSGCLPENWKPHHLAVQLSKSPCLVMAVLRDGAVTCYDTLCESSPKLKSSFVNSGKFMLAGKTLKEAKCLVECFFDHLVPNRKARIELSAS